MKSITQIKIPAIKIVIAVLLLLTMIDAVYYRYQFIRFCTFFLFIWVALSYWRLYKKTDAIICGLCALLFNPFQYIETFTRDWLIVNKLVATVLIIWAAIDLTLIRKSKSHNQGSTPIA